MDNNTQTITELPSYGKVYALGNKASGDSDDIFLNGNRIFVQEKIDGSQISFGNIDGQLMVRSKGQSINIEKPDALFLPSVRRIISAFEQGLLRLNHVYRGEAVSSPRHNTIKYNRAPAGNIVLFDVLNLDNSFHAEAPDINFMANEIGVEPVQIIYGPFSGRPSRDEFEKMKTEWLSATPQLGGGELEGFVMKSVTSDGNLLKVKVVSEKYKERSTKNKTQKKDIFNRLADELITDARYEKALQRLKENGEHTGSLKDIGTLMKYISIDVDEEEKHYLMDELEKYGLPLIKKLVNKGVVDWYKEKLMMEQFSDD